jgi:nicotinamide-nucleotide amidase
MAAGVCRTCHSDWGLATTGVAGPEPQDGHPVGEVYLAVAHPASGLAEVRQLMLTGDRPTIRAAAVAHAVELLAECLAVRVQSRTNVGPIPPDSIWTTD